MKKYMKSFISKTSMVLALIFVITSCDIFKLDINTDPRNPSSATPDLVLPNAILSASSTFGGGFNRNIHGFLGMMTSADDFNLTTSSFSGTWTSLYPGPLKDIEAIITNPNSVNLPVYLGIAQTLKAYYFLNLVDMWGPVPYFDAFKGDNPSSTVLNPKYDDPVEIYKDLFSLLDQAIVNFGVASSVNYAPGDPIFGGDRTKWIKAANSIKLRMLVQTRLVQSKFPSINYVSAINAIVASGQFLSAPGDNMEFRFNAALTPDYRHPWFTSGSTASVYAGTYLSHQLMFEMLENKDPRWPYYFKRQTNSVLNLNDATERGTSPCSSIPGCQYGYMVVGNGGIDVLGRLNAKGIIPFSTYVAASTSNPSATGRLYQNQFLAGIFGRDRADNSGAPSDGALRTAFGAYPAGGYYDDNFPTDFVITAAPATPVSPSPYNATARLPKNNGGSSGGAGNGVFPMITTTNVKLLILEAAATLGTNLPSGTNDRAGRGAYFRQAISEHIDRVAVVAQSVDTKAVLPNSTTKTNYLNLWEGLYTNVANTELDILWKQGWFCAWGNAIDSYNAFRRTGYPASLQSPLNRIRQFALSLPLAIDELTLNASAPQNAPQFDTPEAALFWDQIKFKF